MTGAPRPPGQPGSVAPRPTITPRPAERAIRGTTLADADLLATGAGGLGADLQDYLDHDTRFVVGMVLLIVLLITIIWGALTRPAETFGLLSFWLFSTLNISNLIHG